MICSNGVVQVGPAAWGGYFFGATIKLKRDPSLTLFARDEDDRIFVFFAA
jgi:hypothetical protein